jgi:O-methyltransferase involved in polyketide biosynthesis
VADDPIAPPEFDPARPNIARMYDYLLHGRDNYAADRALGDRVIASMPTVGIGVRAQRDVLGRAVRFLVGEAGLRQLIDIGSGLPTADNVHEIAQRTAPGTRVIYVDNDPVVLAHARALLARDSGTAVVEGDLRAPERILADPLVREHFDWDQPVGLILCGILHHILDEERPAELVAALCRGLPPGSYVFIHHLLDAGDPAIADVQAALQRSLGRGQFRTFEQIRGLFGGLEFVEPGLVLVSRWRPDPGTPGTDDYPVLRLACAGVARK